MTGAAGRSNASPNIILIRMLAMTNLRTLFLIVVASLACCIAPAPARAEPAPPRDKTAKQQRAAHDLTRGDKKDGTPEWNLGPTGARGWIFSRGFDTSESRQILVESVAQGSPADGVLAPGDVILGAGAGGGGGGGDVAGATRFASDARVAFGEAIAKAERDGSLQLLRWRAGDAKSVTIKLAKLPAYAETAPYDCAKSRAIVEAGCRAIAKRGFPGGALDHPALGDNWDPDVLNSVNALALLAGGDAQYADLVRGYAHRVGPANLELKMQEGLYAWTWGYANLFLAEYYLATRDEAVLPAIREYAHKISIGQSEVGTWGHGFKVDGNNGTLGGYGAINQCGLVCWISLILSEKCGVSDPVVSAAVARSRAFFGFYSGKGSIPYGDHPPYWLHDDNGKSSAAAVAFDLLGDEAGARFFSRMATAAYGEKELGHTGNYLGYLWGALGANRAGPQAVAAFLREQRWYYDLARRWDGGFFTNRRDNYDWDMTGVFVLHHALPLKKLAITGRDLHDANILAGKALKDTLDAGRGFDVGDKDPYFAKKSTAQLVDALGDWSPTVRTRAARILSTRKDEADVVVPKLVRMLGSKSLDARCGACLGLEQFGARGAAAVDPLVKLLDDPDMWMRIRAAFALTEIGKPAMKAVPALLRRAALENPADPRGMEAKYLAFALFRADFVDQVPRDAGLISQSMDGVDRELAYPVIRRMLACDDGLGTFAMRSVFKTLSLDELQTLMPSIVKAAHDTAPSGEMFAQEIRFEALRFMADNKVREGLPVFIEYARTQNGWGSKTKEVLPLLEQYGAAAREILPELRALQEKWAAEDAKRDEKPTERTKATVAAEVIRAIESAQQ